jgi:hypothetical protein
MSNMVVNADLELGAHGSQHRLHHQPLAARELDQHQGRQGRGQGRQGTARTFTTVT